MKQKQDELTDRRILKYGLKRTFRIYIQISKKDN